MDNTRDEEMCNKLFDYSIDNKKKGGYTDKETGNAKIMNATITIE